MDLSQELIARRQLVRVSVVRIFRRSLHSTFFDLPSFDMLCKRLKDRLTVKLTIFRLLAGQMENILNLTSNE